MVHANTWFPFSHTNPAVQACVGGGLQKVFTRKSGRRSLELPRAQLGMVNNMHESALSSTSVGFGGALFMDDSDKAI